MTAINKVIKTLIASDFLLQAGWGLIGPIFAIFLTEQIKDGSVATVGFVAATYWLTKSLVQPFIAHYFDRKEGERDDFIFMVAGLYVANLVPIGYLFSNYSWQIILLEFIRGLAMACFVPAWYAIFTRHIDRGWEAFSWSIDSTSIGIAAGFSAAFGGIVAASLGFKILFILVSFFGLLSASMLLLINRHTFTGNRSDPQNGPKR